MSTLPTHQRAWGILPGESVEDYEAFQEYLNRPHASIQEVSTALHRNLGPVAAANRWKMRRAAYLASLAQEAEEAGREHAREIGREHAEACVALRTQALEVLRDAFARGEVDPKLAAKILFEVVDLERLDAGKPTERTAFDLSGKTDQELAELERLLRPASVAAPVLESAPEN